MNCLIINNPVSGHCKTPEQLEEIIGLLKAKYQTVDVEETTPDINAEEISANNLGRYDLYVVLGGDGTFNETLRSLAGKPNRPVMGYIPSGTVNDLALANKIPFDYKQAIEVILNGRAVKKSTMLMNGIPSASYLLAGMFSCVSYTTDQTKKRRFGKLAYYAEILFKDKGRKGERLELEIDGERHDSLYTLVLCLNNRSIGGLKASRLQFGDNDGFYVVLAKRKKCILSMFASLLHLIRALMKKIENYKSTKNLIIKKISYLRAKSLSNTVWNIDGEKGPVGDVEITHKKDQFELMVPNE